MFNAGFFRMESSAGVPRTRFGNGKELAKSQFSDIATYPILWIANIFPVARYD